MEETFFVQHREGERTPNGHRVLAELPHLEVLELSFGPDFGGVDPHTHPDHTDSFYVLEGEVEFTVGDETKRAGPGTWVAAPPGVRHGFAIPGPDGAHFLNIHAPGSGFIDRIRKD
jgi:quercetin dioxygenase-like cupin family protein